jgi:hypothetical protein
VALRLPRRAHAEQLSLLRDLSLLSDLRGHDGAQERRLCPPCMPENSEISSQPYGRLKYFKSGGGWPFFIGMMVPSALLK